MTENTEYETRPLGWRDPEWYAYGLRDGATWMSQRFASWFATAWLYIILWGVVAGAFIVLLYIDGKFSRGLAEGVDDINPLSFQAMGWTYRFFAAAFLMAAARCVHKGLKGAWTFRALGVFASIIVCLHAFGFGFEALDHRRDQAMAARQVIEVASVSYDDQIGLLKEQKGQIDSDLTLAVGALNEEIRQYITDGLDNDDLADDSRERRSLLQDEARAQKRAIDAEILRLTAESATSETQAVETQVEAEPWAPLFVGMAQLASWSKEPSDWTVYLCAIGFVILWVLLGESLVIFLPERIYAMHLRDAELADKGKPKDGEVKVTFTDEEWEEWQAAKDEKDRRMAGAAKAADTKSLTKLLGNASWAREKRDEIWRLIVEGMAPQDIADKFGWSWPEYETLVRRAFNAERAAIALGEDEPEQMTNGIDRDEGADDADDTQPAANP